MMIMSIVTLLQLSSLKKNQPWQMPASQHAQPCKSMSGQASSNSCSLLPLEANTTTSTPPLLSQGCIAFSTKRTTLETQATTWTHSVWPPTPSQKSNPPPLPLPRLSSTNPSAVQLPPQPLIPVEPPSILPSTAALMLKMKLIASISSTRP